MVQSITQHLTGKLMVHYSEFRNPWRWTNLVLVVELPFPFQGAVSSFINIIFFFDEFGCNLACCEVSRENILPLPRVLDSPLSRSSRPAWFFFSFFLKLCSLNFE
uniref:Uncharacterized protein n=1 Tax=Arundo donax TaxID=35708 RepID=A0A0A9DFC1_ARUDO